jgi:hypothetical protein
MDWTLKKVPLIYKVMLLFLALFMMFFVVIQGFVSRKIMTDLLYERQKTILYSLVGWEKSVQAGDFADPVKIISTLESSGKIPFPFKNIVVLDDKGRIQAGTDEAAIGGAEQNNRALRLLKTGNKGFFITRERGALTFSLLFSFRAKDKIIGGVKFSFLVEDIEKKVRSHRNKILLTAFFIFLAGFLLCLFPMKDLQLTLGELNRGLRFISDGNYRISIKGQQKGKTKELMDQFNRVTHTLKARDARRITLMEKLKGIAVSMQFNTLLDKIIQVVQQEMNTEKAIIMVIKDETLVISSIAGYPENLVSRDETYRINEDVFIELIEYGLPIILDDLSEIHSNIRYASVLKHSTPVALFPITQGNEIYGVLHVAGHQGNAGFKASEIEVGQLIAHGAAIAMTHLIQAGEKKESGLGDIEGPLRIFSTLKPIEIGACAHRINKGIEFFEFYSEKRESIMILCVATDKMLKLPAIVERVNGMLSLLYRFRSKMNSLVFFALAILQKMSPSEKRDNYINRFKENPFSPWNLKGLLTDVLVAMDRTITVEVLKIDLKKNNYAYAGEKLQLFHIPKGAPVAIGKETGKFQGGDILIACHRESFSEADLTFIQPEAPIEDMLNALKDNYQKRKDDIPESQEALPVFIVSKNTKN